MTSSPVPDHLVFVRPDQREPGSVTRGQAREKVFDADGLWVGYCDITARDELGEWHHHADFDTATCLISGRCRLHEGSQGEKPTIMSAGDFCLVGSASIPTSNNKGGGHGTAGL